MAAEDLADLEAAMAAQEVSRVSFKAQKHAQQASTLIEVIISIAVVVLVLITLAASGTVVTRNQRFSERQAVATKYTQEAVEWAKNMRQQMGWPTLYDTVLTDSSAGIASYCLATLPDTPLAFASLTPSACQTTDIIAGTEFTRSFQFVIVSPSEIKATVIVDWTDNTTPHQTKSETVLRQWQ